MFRLTGYTWNHRFINKLFDSADSVIEYAHDNCETFTITLARNGAIIYEFTRSLWRY